jgi:hypothetical protein
VEVFTQLCSLRYISRPHSPQWPQWCTMRIKVRHTVYLDPDLSKKLLAQTKRTGALPTEMCGVRCESI